VGSTNVKPDLKVQGDAAVAPAPGGNVVAALPAAEEAEPFHHFELYFGYSMLKSGSDAIYTPSSMATLAEDPRYSLGIRYSIVPLVAITAEGFYLRHVKDELEERDARLDYAFGVELTPIRWRISKWLGFTLGGSLGGMRVPVETMTYHVVDMASSVPNASPNFQSVFHNTLVHEMSPYLGGHASFAFGNSVALNVDLRKITRYDGTLASASLGFLL
jgi:hypothetical protein